MSLSTRRRVPVVICVAMVAIALFALISGMLSKGGLGSSDWLSIGSALTVTVLALTQVFRLGRGDGAPVVTWQAKIVVISVASAAFVFLLLAGVSGRSARSWIFPAVLVVALGLVVGGFVMRPKRSVSAE